MGKHRHTIVESEDTPLFENPVRHARYLGHRIDPDLGNVDVYYMFGWIVRVWDNGWEDYRSDRWTEFDQSYRAGLTGLWIPTRK